MEFFLALIVSQTEVLFNFFQKYNFLMSLVLSLDKY